ncbi:FMN reductase [Cnuibacter physcomitrellae]|uniref:FMN reductase n=1 Tax=Cnuibacter physcomitrellae TaxID=1619308 RepID=A0A1X9LN75_9MICO|nr:NAD(P)H-dependent oxidoreductase [Cnuibacter physcomitrellae]ARJ06665.1 FMN reductase [Cnuibacter physcomitrellae]GGI38543.1 FMN reductase [Cnuibacter physcomitrellae]
MTSSVLVLVGSLRSGSTNRQIAHTALELAPEGLELRLYDGLADIPFYNEDIDVEGSVPAAATAFREAVAAADAVLVITPEHNGTIPAVLKNAIDWSSRPFGSSPISAKPVAVVGAAFGQYGGVWSHDEARKALGIAGANVLDDIRMSVPGSMTRFVDVHPREDVEVTTQLRAVLADLQRVLSAPADSSEDAAA